MSRPTRQILNDILFSLSELQRKSCSGGEIEHKFNLHIDDSVLEQVADLLNDLDMATDNK